MNNLYISGSCVLRKGRLLLNDRPLFEGESKLEEVLDYITGHHELSHPRFDKLDRLSRLGFACTEMVLKSLDRTDIQDPYDVALLFMNRSSSLDTDFRFHETISNIASPAVFVYTLPNVLMAEICIRNGFKGENTFLITDKPDAALYLDQLEVLFSQTSSRACIAGWVNVLKEEYECIVLFVEKTENVVAGKREITLETLKEYFY